MSRLMRRPGRVLVGGVALVLLQLLTACGGGSSGDDDELLPTLSQDVEPSGERVDVSDRNYFPIHEGDTWLYARTVEGDTAGTTQRRIETAPNEAGEYLLSESDDLQTFSTYQRITTAGVETLDPVGAQGFWPGVYAALPTFLDFPTPFYAAGSTRSVLRQGDLQADVDGDGKDDRFRIEVKQVFVGFEQLAVLGRATEVAHFKTTFTLTLASVSTGESSKATFTEESYLAPNIGLVRIERSVTVPDGAEAIPDERLDLVSASIGQKRYFKGGSGFEIEQYHRDVVFDPSRGLYFASVAAGDVEHANRIATIDPSTGGVTYSDPVGADPGPLAVSSDGKVLYVGLEASGEILKLALPSMQELARTRLPVDMVYGQYLPEDISLSPDSDDVIAVSMMRAGWSPRHAGVVLLRDMAIQPVRTQDHTGSNHISFGSDGRWLYGYNDETSEFGLRRIEVLADGLVESMVVAADGFDRDMTVTDGIIAIGNTFYAADAGMGRLGSVELASECVKLPSVDKVVCQSTLSYSSLVIADSLTFTPLETVTYSPSWASTTEWQLVPGPRGQVLIMEYGRIVIFDSDALR